MRLIQAALGIAPGPESVRPERIGNKGVKLFDCQQKRYIFALDAFFAGRTPILVGIMGRFALCESVNNADLSDLGWATDPARGNEHPPVVEKLRGYRGK